MDIEINGRAIRVAEGCKTLGQLLQQEGFSGIGRAVAVNNRVVPRAMWDDTELIPRMKITVISAVCGG